MRFLDLYISGFGKFHNTSVSFEDGINIVYGKNEAGKSTIHTFIRGMLFGIERQRGRAAGRIPTASTSHGKTAEPTKDSCAWNPTVLYTALSGAFRRIKKDLSLLMKPWEKRWSRPRHLWMNCWED